jgi:hypothetical protein
VRAPLLPLIPHAARHVGSVPAEDVVADGGLLDTLARAAEPRSAPGVRHGLIGLLGLAGGAVLGGARSNVAIAEWARDLTVVARVRRHPG